jgi:hypothetical protein
MMNQPVAFSWNKQASEAALKAGATAGITDTGAYEGDILSAVYEFGKDGSQSQALVLSIDVNGQKANFLRINFLGRWQPDLWYGADFCPSVGCSGKGCATATTSGPERY